MIAQVIEQVEFFSEAELESLEFVPEELEAIEAERVPDLDSISFEDIAKDMEAYFKGDIKGVGLEGNVTSKPKPKPISPQPKLKPRPKSPRQACQINAQKKMMEARALAAKYPGPAPTVAILAAYYASIKLCGRLPN